ncbi:hypothetical protein QJS04_geneDACA010979 [Acorus gramineus]|uniref:Uncharacterized protein n=1 Tax=Acorus gramineus TaxID=55184 RepID=A0AAV9BF95_ACOGR|nr:hypothetical protein QJS04_geneDACA010979 [Acorus gramineus]
MNDDEDPSSSNGGRASKKQKTMRIPRRGLGVAQLEKLRLEEVEKQQNNQIQGSVTTNTVTASLYSLPPPTRLHNQKSFLFSDLNNVNGMKDYLSSSSSSARRPSLPVPLPAFSNLHMEPPSNQSSSGNKLIEEEKENVNEPFPVPFYRFLPMSNGTDEAALDHQTRASGSVGAASDQQMDEAPVTEKIDLTLRL